MTYSENISSWKTTGHAYLATSVSFNYNFFDSQSLDLTKASWSRIASSPIKNDLKIIFFFTRLIGSTTDVITCHDHAHSITVVSKRDLGDGCHGRTIRWMKRRTTGICNCPSERRSFDWRHGGPSRADPRAPPHPPSLVYPSPYFCRPETRRATSFSLYKYNIASSTNVVFFCCVSVYGCSVRCFIWRNPCKDDRLPFTPKGLPMHTIFFLIGFQLFDSAAIY